MAKEFFAAKRPHAGLTFDAYLTVMEQQAEQDPTGLDEEQADRVAFTKLNLQRSRRIMRTHKVGEALRGKINKLIVPQLWMVLTEPWCGDSAQCLPYIALMASLHEGIDLRILLRDQNLDIMDQYLTNGSRGIPCLVIFDADGEELYQWGPRPAETQEIFLQAKAEGLEKPQLLERMHLWYGRNRGAAIEAEFLTLLA